MMVFVLSGPVCPGPQPKLVLTALTIVLWPAVQPLQPTSMIPAAPELNGPTRTLLVTHERLQDNPNDLLFVACGSARHAA
jgi:hypothetical protein